MATQDHQKILDAIAELEKEYDVRVLLATEAGSRAWGLSTTDSDYDVKFVYAHNPGWYMRIDEGQRDVIDKSVEEGFLDLNGPVKRYHPEFLTIQGWDIRKAVKMLRESNCFIFEWLTSDIKYKFHQSFVEEALELGMTHISWKAIAFHYLNKAKKHLREYFEGDRWKDEVILKKYFFVLQPLFSIERLRVNKELPPRLVTELLASITLPDDVGQEVYKLIELKKKGELLNGAPIKILDDWIAESLVRCEKFAAKELPGMKHPASSPFNQLIEKYVMEPYTFVGGK